MEFLQAFSLGFLCAIALVAFFIWVVWDMKA